MDISDLWVPKNERHSYIQKLSDGSCLKIRLLSQNLPEKIGQPSVGEKIVIENEKKKKKNGGSMKWQ